MTNSTVPAGRENKRRKTTIVRLALVGVAVAGVGAALTSAAWTDQAWFTAEASAADIELYGTLGTAGSCPAAGDAAYVEANTLPDAVDITLAPFEDLVPGEERTVTICLWNGSDVNLSVSQAPIATSGDPVFGTGGATIGVEDGGAAYVTQTLAVDAVKPLEVLVHPPGDWAESFQGAQSGELAITFTGSTDLP